MQYKIERKEAPEWGKVDVLGETYEEGLPEGEEMGRWRKKLETRQDIMRYLESGIGMPRRDSGVKRGKILLKKEVKHGI